MYVPSCNSCNPLLQKLIVNTAPVLVVVSEIVAQFDGLLRE